MRVPIAYALHHPERVDVPVPRARPRRGRRARLRAARPRGASRACASPARPRVAGGTAPCVLNAANEVAVHAFLAGRLGFMGIPAVIEAHARAAAGRAACTPSSRSTSADAEARARSPASSSAAACARVSWLLAFLGFAALIILHELGPLRRGQGGRDARRALLAVLPAAARAGPARRDRVRDRLDPARRLREDHRHEPGGGDPAGGRPPRLLPPAGVEADRRDRRRARRSTSCSRS